MDTKLKITKILFLLFLLSASASGQLDCDDPLILSGESPFIIDPVSSQGNGIEEDLSEYCVNTEFAPRWIELNIKTSGVLIFTITPGGENDDIDFILFKMDGNCDSKTVSRCMASGETAGQNSTACFGPTGLSVGEVDVEELPGCGNGSNNFLAPVDVQSGESYMLLINNFSLSESPYEISFGGSACIESIISSTEEIEETESFVMVTPTVSQTGIFDIHFNLSDTNFNYKVFNAFGTLVKLEANYHSEFDRLELSDQAKGTYFLVVENEGKLFTTKLMYL